MTGNEATLHGAPYTDSAGPSLSLTVEQGPQAGCVVECRRVVTLIGSREGCKVLLKHPLVAPVHVALVNDGVEVHAVDLVTDRGTLLNELKMEHERLSDGDALTVDPWVFRVSLRNGDHSGNGRPRNIPLEFAPQLIALEHLNSGRILQPNRKVCTVGRRSGCDIHVDDRAVSRAHAIFFLHGDKPTVFDLLSSNGTLVNDEPVCFRALEDQDVVRIGDARFRVHVVVPSTGTPKSKDALHITPPGTRPPPPDSNGARQDVDPEPDMDLVDIQAVEGSQRWRIADKLEKASGKR